VVGWEANGGFLVGSEIERDGRRLAPLATRDAALPIAVALHAAAEARRPLHEVLEALPRRYTRAGLLDEVPVEQSRALIRRLSPEGVIEAEAPFSGPAAGSVAALSRVFSPERGFGAIRKLNFLDGVRVTFDGGDIAHVRPSGNAPQLRIYAVAGSEARAAAIVALALEEPRGLLRALLAG
jgi:phosphomannomutase